MGMQAIGPIMGIARMAVGGLNKSQGINPTPASSPFDAIFHPEQALMPVEAPVPERGPRAEQAQMQRNRDETPGLMASALLGDNSPDVWGMTEDDMTGPGSSRMKNLPPVRIDMAQNTPRSNEELMKAQGYNINSVQAQEVPPGSPVTPFDAPTGGVTDIPRTPPVAAAPQSVFDDELPAPAIDTEPPVATTPSALEPQFDTAAAMPEEEPADAFGGGINAIQDWLEGSPENPLFQTGMALMASGYDGSNPFTGTQAGLNAIPQLAMQKQKTDLERRKGEAQIADAEQQKKLQEALAMIASMYGGGQSSGDGPASQRSKGQAGLIR